MPFLVLELCFGRISAIHLFSSASHRSRRQNYLQCWGSWTKLCPFIQCLCAETETSKKAKSWSNDQFHRSLFRLFPFCLFCRQKSNLFLCCIESCSETFLSLDLFLSIRCTMLQMLCQITIKDKDPLNPSKRSQSRKEEFPIFRKFL